MPDTPTSEEATRKRFNFDLSTFLLYEAMLEESPCACTHGRLWHTFTPSGESLCDLCECEDYRAADIVKRQAHEGRPAG
jgi:hypothetical protein